MPPSETQAKVIAGRNASETDGSPIAGEQGEPEVSPADIKCKAPDPVPDQPLRNSLKRISARVVASRCAYAQEQVEQGRLGGPFPFDTEGRLLAGNGL